MYPAWPGGPPVAQIMQMEMQARQAAEARHRAVAAMLLLLTAHSQVAVGAHTTSTADWIGRQ